MLELTGKSKNFQEICKGKSKKFYRKKNKERIWLLLFELSRSLLWKGEYITKWVHKSRSDPSKRYKNDNKKSIKFHSKQNATTTTAKRLNFTENPVWSILLKLLLNLYQLAESLARFSQSPSSYT